ncbi:Myb-like DNA-binding domain containing protein [Histomonas meleagridis]|uniref:Myb-like DNA-binding domain containing protein n=1 Tax=Histomonas meleagridis TaxID=135588 RepID=UPI00355A2810|nr:Myb-like DNA-binding domain containing protein [Histomonas meleagridis]KAH0806197.1 Myb-like DNA-binding domain containing protein [Histomonas meleagridis]
MDCSPEKPIAPTRKRTRNSAQNKYQKWKPEEDALLHQIVTSQKNVNWKLAEAHFPGKTSQQIFERWTKVLDPTLMKGSWTRQEDEVIIKFVTENGCKSWTKLASLLPGRIGKQCRERWMNHLNPNISRSAWTLEEDRILYKLHEQFGNHWSKISQFMPSRTDNMIKNRWYSVLSKKSPSELQEEPVATPTAVDSNEKENETEKDYIPKPFEDSNTEYKPSWMNGNATPFSMTPFQGTPMGSISPMFTAGSPFSLFSPCSKQSPFSPWIGDKPSRNLLMSPTKPKNSPPSLSENRVELMNLFVHQ